MSYQRSRTLILPLLIMLGLLFFSPAPLHAQPVLIQSYPAEDQVVTEAPQALTLIFDRAISAEDLEVSVTNGAGESMVKGDPTVSITDLFRVETALDPLPDGIYTVSYRVKAVGGSAAIRGEYSFTVQLPDPQLYLLTPIDGEPVFTDTVDLLMRIESTSFDYYNTRIHVYLDGEMLDSIDRLEYTITGLDKGVHEIRVLLSQFDQELVQTEKIVHIAVAADPEAAVSADPPAQGIIPNTTGWAVITFISALIVGAGYVLGRKTPRDLPPDGEEG